MWLSRGRETDGSPGSTESDPSRTGHGKPLDRHAHHDGGRHRVITEISQGADADGGAEPAGFPVRGTPQPQLASVFTTERLDAAAKRVLDVVVSLVAARGARAADADPGGARASRLARARVLPGAASRPRQPRAADAEVPQDARRRDGHRADDGRRRAPHARRRASSPSPSSTRSRSCGTCCAGDMSLVGPRPETLGFVELPPRRVRARSCPSGPGSSGCRRSRS